MQGDPHRSLSAAKLCNPQIRPRAAMLRRPRLTAGRPLTPFSQPALEFGWLETHIAPKPNVGYAIAPSLRQDPGLRDPEELGGRVRIYQLARDRVSSARGGELRKLALWQIVHIPLVVGNLSGGRSGGGGRASG